MLWATQPAAWKWEASHEARCEQLLCLLVNRRKDFSPLCGPRPQGWGVPDTPTPSRRSGLPGSLPGHALGWGWGGMLSLRRADPWRCRDKGSDRVWGLRRKKQPWESPFSPTTGKSFSLDRAVQKQGSDGERRPMLTEHRGSVSGKKEVEWPLVHYPERTIVHKLRIILPFLKILLNSIS